MKTSTAPSQASSRPLKNFLTASETYGCTPLIPISEVIRALTNLRQLSHECSLAAC